MTKVNKEHASVVGGICDMTKEFSGSVGSTTSIGTIYDLRWVYIVLHVHVWEKLHNKMITDKPSDISSRITTAMIISKPLRPLKIKGFHMDIDMSLVNPF